MFDYLEKVKQVVEVVFLLTNKNTVRNIFTRL